MRSLIVMAMTLTLAVSSAAYAVAPQFWRTRNTEDFLTGEIEGFAVTSRGELRPGPSLEKVASFTDPFVLAQAAGSNGDRYFGTGNDGKIYRLRGKELKLFYTASEPEIYALTFHDGALFAGTSPNGKIYRIDPATAKSTTYFDPKEAYIWAIEFLPGGDLAVATGVGGKLFRVNAKGEGKVLFDAPETHLRSLAVRPDGTLLVGGSGKGRIYEVRPDGIAHALFDSPLSEISSIYIDPSGLAWAAGVSNVLPTAAPAKAAAAAKTQQSSTATTTTASSDTPKKDGDAAATSVDVSFSFDDGSATATAGAQSGSGELYRINPDGFVETVRKFEREMIYAISAGRDGGLLLSTGPQGRIYELRKNELALIAAVPEKQIVSIDGSGGDMLVTTTNSGAIYRMGNAASTTAEFRSSVKDVERFSRFGHYHIGGSNVGDGRVAIAFRSGNTRTPDTTWSGWSSAQPAAEGTINTPAARYVQWKLTMPHPSSDVSIDDVTLGYINRNVSPSIDSVTVNEPAVVFIASNYPSSPQVVEATNPDEYGIFVSLDTPRDRSTDPGKRVFRKGYRTISWRAHDDNGDSLRYSLAFRIKGSDRWLRLRDNIEESSVNFDTSQLPDGRYELRLTATDGNDNADAPLTDVKEGFDFDVDNTPPLIAVSYDGNQVVVRVTDKTANVGRVELSADAQKWTRLTPVDGIADSPDETYRLDRGLTDGKFVIIRAVDGFYNVATVTIPSASSGH
jgi:hypothetical protein